MISLIRDFLVDDRIKNVDADSDDRVSVHASVLSQKNL